MKQIIYIANSGSNNIEGWNLHKNGQIELIHTIETLGQIQPMKIIKNHNFLYAGIRPNNRVIVYSIQKNGMLVKKYESTLPGTPNYISFDENKKFLFCSSYHQNCISVSPLDTYGYPRDPIQVIHDLSGCHASKFNNKYGALFITALKEDRIYLYYLTHYGILKNTEQKYISTQKNSGPRHIVFHPNKNIFYTINELNGTVDIWKIFLKNNIFQVKNIQNINILGNSIETKYWSSDIHLTSCGKFLYVSDREHNSISLFHVNNNDSKIVLYKIYKTEEQPRSFCIDKYNKYLIVAGQKSNFIAIYEICEKTGSLRYLNRYKTGKSPLWISTHTI